MNYTLNQLRIFLQVTKTLSITKAAEELHLTQPAVSIQLKNFQDQFDSPLIEVINKRVYITDMGHEIATAAEKILDEVNAINLKMHSMKGLLTGKLKISVVSTGKYIAPYFLTNFIKNQPGIELVIDVTNKSEVLLSLENNEVDFALVSVLPENLNIDKVELMQNKLFLVGNNKSPFEKNKLFDKKILNDIPLIYRERGSGTRLVMERFFLKNEIPVSKKMELTSNEAVKQAVIAGLGLSIMPLIGIKNELENEQLRIINVKGFPIKSNWCIIWQKNKNFSPVAKSFLKHIQKEKKNIINEHFDWYEKY